MNNYSPPLKDMSFALQALANLELVCAQPRFADASVDLVGGVLGEAAKLAEKVLAPMIDAGEHAPPKIVDQQVVETPGFADLYRQLVEGGWMTVSAEPQSGGMGLPQSVGFVIMEMWSSANLSFALCPMLSQGAVEAVERHASDGLKTVFLERLVNGEWAGTMNLTEPQAGSDLGAINTKAVLADDHYLITGSKIFITWGDHAMTENIVHLVLARVDGAPGGVGGISMFLVPKYLVNADGSPGEHNDVYAVVLEEKMGIHGSPTCAMNYGEAGVGAVGYLVGEENKGLVYMFTMMNHARLNVGIQGVALSERACQMALTFAAERIQGRPVGRNAGAIVYHPDVRRMLVLMRSLTDAARALCYTAAGCMDLAQRAQDEALREDNRQRLELLIPLTKAWSTEAAQEVTSLGMQVHGGMGYIEETGAAQLARDARITTVYEGTTGIQANDFVGRKVLRDGGVALRRLLDEIRLTQQVLAAHSELAPTALGLQREADSLERTLNWLLEQVGNESQVASAATNFLMGCGTCVAGWLLAKAALAATELCGDDATFIEAKITVSNFFAVHVLPRAGANFSAVEFGDHCQLLLTDIQLGF